jgi:hypothetical protein
MSGKLTKTVDTNYREKKDDINDLETVPQNLHNQNQSENLAHLEVIRKNERPGLFGIIKPSKTQIKQEELTIQWMDTEFQHSQAIKSVIHNIKEGNYKVAGEYYQQSLIQRFEGQLIKQGMHILADLSKTVLLIREEMIDDITRSNESFIEKMKKADVIIQRSKDDPFQHERAIKNKQFLISNHFDTGEELLEKFIRLLRVSLDQKAKVLTQEV